MQNSLSINRIELVAQTSYPVIKGCQPLTPRVETKTKTSKTTEINETFEKQEKAAHTGKGVKKKKFERTYCARFHHRASRLDLFGTRA